MSVERAGSVSQFGPVRKSRLCVDAELRRTGGSQTASRCAIYGGGGRSLFFQDLLQIGGITGKYEGPSSRFVEPLPDNDWLLLICDSGVSGTGCRLGSNSEQPEAASVPGQGTEWQFGVDEDQLLEGAPGTTVYTDLQSIGVSDSGRHIIGAGRYGIHWWDRVTGEVKRVFGGTVPGGVSVTRSVAVSPSGRYVAVGSGNFGTSLSVYDTADCPTLDADAPTSCPFLNLSDLVGDGSDVITNGAGAQHAHHQGEGRES